MILVDSSVWIDHFRRPEVNLEMLLDKNQVFSHPFVVGELAIGHLKDRKFLIEMHHELPQAVVAEHEEVLRLVETCVLHGRGIGYADAHLLASARLTPETRLWSRDKRVAVIAAEFAIAYSGEIHDVAPFRLLFIMWLRTMT